MNFYQLLQLDPSTLKYKVHSTDDKKKKMKFMLCLSLRAVLIVLFAIFWITSLTFLFSKDTSSLALILFCILLNLRYVPFGYKLKQSIIGLGFVLFLFWLAPFIYLIPYATIQLLFHFSILLSLFLITGKEPKMGNPALYSFSYLYLIGTTQYTSTSQILHSFFILLFTYILFSIIYYKKFKSLNEDISFTYIIKEGINFNKKSIWFFYYALGISSLLVLGNYLHIDRFMWATFACSSLFSGYDTFKISNRAKERIVGVILGSILSGILLFVIPTNFLGMLGGVSLGFCATYQNKTIFNCIGAITVATLLFGLKTSIFLRILLNILGIVYGLLYHYIFTKILKYLLKRKKYAL